MKISNINEILSKYVNNKGLYIIIIIGIAFMLLPDFNGKKNDNRDTTAFEMYSDEARLSAILSKVSGAGKVSVMITYCGTTAYDIAYEEKTDENSSDKTAVSDNGSPFITGKTYPKVKGVIAVSDSALTDEVTLSLKSAISSVLGIPTYKICVLEGKERN